MLPLPLLGLALAVIAGSALGAKAPDDLAAALKAFRTEGPPGWAFRQTSEGEGKRLVEDFTPLAPPLLRWTLIEKDGHQPSADEGMRYRQEMTQRSSVFNAPRIENELDLSSCEVLSDDGSRLRAKFNLKTDSNTEEAAKHLDVVCTFHRPSRTIEEIDIRNRDAFSPTFAVKIEAMRTVLRYSLPRGDTPSLLESVSITIRGRLFWLKSLDQTLLIRRSDYRYAGRKPSAMPMESLR